MLAILVILLLFSLSSASNENSRRRLNGTSQGLASKRDIKLFMVNDYVGPLYLARVNNTDTIRQLRDSSYANKAPYNVKNFHQFNSVVQEIAMDPYILSFLKPVLGNNVFLWGTQLITQKANFVHQWHVDIEHSHNISGVTVWICLETQSDIPKLQLISRSEKIKYSPQESGERQPKDKVRLNSTRMLEISQEFSDETKLITVTPRVGDMVIWKGRVWHHTNNLSPHDRVSLILQYVGNYGNIETDVPKVPASFGFPHTKWHDTKDFMHFPFPIKIRR